MDKLRAIIRWIQRHRLVSAILGLAVIGSIVAGRTLAFRTEGKLSEPLQTGEAVDAVYGIGTVTAVRSFSIKPGVTSTINNLYVKEGDSVHKGDKLAKIDAVPYFAPFDGVINFLPFKVGENIFAQTPILVLTDLKNRYLLVSMEQQGALRVKVGQRAKLSFDSIREQTFEGVVESVYSYNSNFLARINVTDLPAQILPDMTADVAIIIQDVKVALLVPISALDRDSVWVKRGRQIPTRVRVKLGIVDGAKAQVIAGDLRAGDQVLTGRRLGL